MKLTHTKLFKSLVAASILCISCAAAFADTNPAPSTPPATAPPSTQPANPPAAKPAVPANKSGLPDVTLPFTFHCPHCGMLITIKKPSDWKGSCGSCACGNSNLECYNETLKKSHK